MKSQDLLVKSSEIGAVLGRGAAKAVAKTGEVGSVVGGSTRTLGQMVKSFGKGIKQGWKDEKNNILIAHKVSETNIVPRIIIVNAHGNAVKP